MTTQVELTSPTAKGYKLWADNVYDDKDAGAIRYFKGYVFNITNPVEVLEQGSKPILAQFGTQGSVFGRRTVYLGICPPGRVRQTPPSPLMC
eukprot:scaffold650_cov407-Prasinococcus_capsulatus_cf.AAC.33